MHDLIALKLRGWMGGGKVIGTQFLDQRRTRRLVFDEHDLGIMEFCHLANGPFKLWEIHFASEDIKEVQRTILDASGCANAKVGEFSILIRSVPTLQDLIEAVRLFIRTIEFEPLAFNNNAGLRLGILLILRHEIVVSHSAALDLQRNR